jgi:flagellar motor switch protein FliM
MVVCGYQQHILKTVASMIQKKPNGANNKKGTQSNRRSQDRVGGYIKYGIIKIIIEVFFRSLKEAWAPLLQVDFEHTGSEINPQFAQIADENDLVIMTRFETESVGGVKGFVDLVYPYASLKPLRDLLRNRVQADGSEESDLKWRDELTLAVGDSQLELQVLLGTVLDDYSRVKQLKEGDLLFFKKPELATMLIGGLPAFEVQVGMSGPQVAVRIEKATSPETL